MSVYPFRDTVTIYHRSSGRTSRRIIKGVRCIFTEGEPIEKCHASVYIPFRGKRDISYCSPDDFSSSRKDLFTVSAGDSFVCRECSLSAPYDAMTVTEVSVNTLGSKRMHHIKIVGSIPKPEEDDE